MMTMMTTTMMKMVVVVKGRVGRKMNSKLGKILKLHSPKPSGYTVVLGDSCCHL